MAKQQFHIDDQIVARWDFPKLPPRDLSGGYKDVRRGDRGVIKKVQPSGSALPDIVTIRFDAHQKDRTICANSVRKV